MASPPRRPLQCEVQDCVYDAVAIVKTGPRGSASAGSVLACEGHRTAYERNGPYHGEYRFKRPPAP